MTDFRTTSYEFGDYRLDPVAGCLTRRGDLVPLPPKALDLLFALVRQPGAIVSKQRLMDTVWPDVAVEESNLNQTVFLLRGALGSASEGHQVIATVPRRGYRFAMNVRAVETPCRIKSVAVLPFMKVGADADEEYFADGMTDALIANLAKIRALRVVSRTSAMRYKGVRAPIADIARSLRVDAVIEGSACRSNGRVRITVQLILASTEQHLWTETYEEKATDVLTLQNCIARAVADRISAALTQDEATRLVTSPRVHPDAYSLYLKGRFFARNLTEAAQRRAIAYYEQAIDRDPQFAAPHAGIAECLTMLAFFFGMVPKDAFSAAKPAAMKAAALDPLLADAHAILGLLHLLDGWDWEAGERESRRAAELSPGDAYVQWRRGAYLQYAARLDEAVEAHRLAESLDPFSLLAIEEAGWPLYYARRYKEALAQFARAVELSPEWAMPYFGLGLTHSHALDHASAIAALERAVALSGPNAYFDATLCYVYARAGRRDDALATLKRVETEQPYVPYWYRAMIRIGMEQFDGAFESLDQAFADREPCLVTLGVDPVFDPLRSDSRFDVLLRRIRPEK